MRWVHKWNSTENCHDLHMNMLKPTNSHIERWHQYWRTLWRSHWRAYIRYRDIRYHSPGWNWKAWVFMITSSVWCWMSALIALSQRLLCFCLTVPTHRIQVCCIWQAHESTSSITFLSCEIKTLCYCKTFQNKYGLITLTQLEDDELWNNNVETYFWGQREREA